jgi:hypothetical protein
MHRHAAHNPLIVLAFFHKWWIHPRQRPSFAVNEYAPAGSAWGPQNFVDSHDKVAILALLAKTADIDGGQRRRTH